MHFRVISQLLGTDGLLETGIFVLASGPSARSRSSDEGGGELSCWMVKTLLLAPVGDELSPCVHMEETAQPLQISTIYETHRFCISNTVGHGKVSTTVSKDGEVCLLRQ